jgi:stearoyl-CoA desaturase (delta-9 desaturase)
MAYFTFGEGYHNFHHFFQTDFRNGIHWYDFDPTKWLIKTLSHAKLATNLKVTPKRSILKARLTMRMLAVEDISSKKLSDLEELQKQILESLKNIENFKNELKLKKREFDSFSKKLMKRKISQAKKELQFHLVLWKLSIKKLEQSYI